MFLYSVTGDRRARCRAKAVPVGLLVDDKAKEWTSGETHGITDRSFDRRVLRLDHSLPGDKSEHWIWQRGPWL